MADEVSILRDEVSRLRDEITLAKQQAAAFAGGASASRPATLAELVERRNALRAIKEANMSCAMVRSAGYTCAEAKEVGYTLAEAKAAGWSSEELRAASYITSKFMTWREFFDRYQAGCTNFSGLDFSGEDFSLMVLDKPCSFGGCNLTDATFHHAKLVGIDLSGTTMTRGST